MDLSKITKGTLTSLLNDLSEFAGTPKVAPKGTRRKAFHVIAAKAVETGVATLEELGMSAKQIKLIKDGKPAHSTFEQRQTLAAIVAGASRRCGLNVPPKVEQHFNV